ncbi:hypothetical protein [Mycobacterium sp.]|uniref:hypothetical protein n=1 Tax=Mycobacterium sp. TaxID=1785 RepID=UPI002619C91A|nr:hypothetical protein [Mycobacterium sp.]
MSRRAKAIASLAGHHRRHEKSQENHDMLTGFKAQKVAATPTDSGPQSMSVNGARVVMIEHYGTLVGDGAVASRSASPPVSEPIATPWGIEHLDFALVCQLAFLDNGFRCARPAAAYVEFHMVGYCKRFDCDESGNATGYVCAGHLDALEYTAECTVRELRPATPARWLSHHAVRCPTCDRSIRCVSDILQVVVMI